MKKIDKISHIIKTLVESRIKLDKTVLLLEPSANLFGSLLFKKKDICIMTLFFLPPFSK